MQSTILDNNLKATELCQLVKDALVNCIPSIDELYHDSIYELCAHLEIGGKVMFAGPWYDVCQSNKNNNFRPQYTKFLNSIIQVAQTCPHLLGIIGYVLSKSVPKYALPGILQDEVVNIMAERGVLEGRNAILSLAFSLSEHYNEKREIKAWIKANRNELDKLQQQQPTIQQKERSKFEATEFTTQQKRRMEEFEQSLYKQQPLRKKDTFRQKNIVIEEVFSGGDNQIKDLSPEESSEFFRSMTERIVNDLGQSEIDSLIKSYDNSAQKNKNCVYDTIINSIKIAKNFYDEQTQTKWFSLDDSRSKTETTKIAQEFENKYLPYLQKTAAAELLKIIEKRSHSKTPSTESFIKKIYQVISCKKRAQNVEQIVVCILTNSLGVNGKNAALESLNKAKGQRKLL